MSHLCNNDCWQGRDCTCGAFKRTAKPQLAAHVPIELDGPHHADSLAGFKLRHAVRRNRWGVALTVGSVMVSVVGIWWSWPR